MEKSSPEKQYHLLFPTDKEKAEAFDVLAKEYYYGNFGKLQKSDFEVLLFSVYLDQILKISEDDMRTYSDYSMSKYLGITQAKIRNLKIKKELQYPNKDFDWKKSFERIIGKAHYEQGKIVINIPDVNLYYEIKNAIEEKGGYIEIQLNSSLMKIAPEFFIDLILTIDEEKNEEEIRKKLKKILSDNKIDTTFLDRKTISEFIQDNAENIGINLLAEIISYCVPGVGGYISNLIKNTLC